MALTEPPVASPISMSPGPSPWWGPQLGDPVSLAGWAVLLSGQSQDRAALPACDWGSSILSPVVPTSLGTRTGMGFVSPGCRHWLVSSQAPFYGLLFEPEELCCICKTHRCNRGNSLPNWIGTARSNWLFGSSRFKSSCARLNKFVRLYQLGKLCWRGDLLNDLPCF